MKVSVICLTYNHQAYVRQSLDGFVMQKTNFPFEVWVGDDASTDKTPAIVSEYAAKYPDIIKPVLRKENVGPAENAHDLYRRVTAPYVAICEGDDYWTDPLKLQKQADFLDAHPDFSLCFHPVAVCYDNNAPTKEIFPEKSKLFYKKKPTYRELLKGNFIQTNSVLYRWRFHKDSLNLLPKDIQPADWFMHLLHAQIGKIGFLPDVMGVYRRHGNGMWTDAGKTDDWFIKHGPSHLRFYLTFQKQFSVSKKVSIGKLLFDISLAALNRNDEKTLSFLKETFPTEFEDIVFYLKNYSAFTEIKEKILSKITFGFNHKMMKHHLKRKQAIKEFLLKNSGKGE